VALLKNSRGGKTTFGVYMVSLGCRWAFTGQVGTAAEVTSIRRHTQAATQSPSNHHPLIHTHLDQINSIIVKMLDFLYSATVFVSGLSKQERDIR
jgi:hypothetical protein